MSITVPYDNQSAHAELSAHLQAAIAKVHAAYWAMKSIGSDDDATGGITDADWLGQIADLLAELDPETRSARCPECGGSQLVFCEEVNIHYPLTNADAERWWFGGRSEAQETGHWRIECNGCGHELRTAAEARGFEHVRVIVDGESY